MAINFKDNTLIYSFIEKVDIRDLSLKIINNAESQLDIAWDEKEERFRWINSGANLTLSSTYPDRDIIGDASIELNPCLVNFLTSSARDYVFKIQLFHKNEVLDECKVTPDKFRKEIEDQESKKLASQGIGANLVVALNDMNDSAKNVFRNQDVEVHFAEDSAFFDSSQVKDEDNSKGYSAQNDYSFENNKVGVDGALYEKHTESGTDNRQMELNAFFHRIGHQNIGATVSESWIRLSFILGICIVAVLFGLCIYFQGQESSKDNFIQFLFPNKSGEQISFYWVIITFIMFFVALGFKFYYVNAEISGKASDINNRLFVEINNNKNNFKQIADQAIMDLKIEKKMHFIGLFSDTLVPYTCENNTAYGSLESAIEHFNEDTVGSHTLHYSRTFMPSILTAFGVLGTFIGLLLSLTSLRDYGIGVGSESSDMVPQIKELIRGASTAFITSIWGVLLSILYTLVLSAAKIFSTKMITNLQKNIDDVFYPYLNLNSDSKDSVQTAIRKLGVKLDENSNVMAEKIALAITAYVAKVNDSTVGSIRIIVNEFKEQFLQILKDQAKDLDAAANRLVKAQDSAAEHVKEKYEQWELQHKTLVDVVQKEFDSIQNSSNAFVSQLVNIDQSFARLNENFDNASDLYMQLIKNASDNQNIMKDVVNELNTRIEHLQNIFNDSVEYQTKMIQNSSSFRELMEQQNSYQKVIQDAVVKLNQSCSTIVNLRDTLDLEVKRECEILTDQFKQANELHSLHIKENIEMLNECWVNVVKENIDKLKNAFGYLEKADGELQYEKKSEQITTDLKS